MYAHGIKVLDRADDNAVAGHIAHYLELKFFPTEHTLLDKDLVHRREIDSTFENVDHLFAVVRDPAARASHSEAGAKNDWISHALCKGEPVFDIVDEQRLGHIQADLAHRVLEKQAILGLFDGVDVSSDEFDPEVI